MAVIAKEPIRNQVADLLREDILMGKYRPGDHIITAGLAEEFPAFPLPLQRVRGTRPSVPYFL